jgi:hypothetical protein
VGEALGVAYWPSTVEPRLTVRSAQRTIERITGRQLSRRATPPPLRRRTVLRIQTPDETREAIDAIFAPFLSGVDGGGTGDVQRRGRESR